MKRLPLWVIALENLQQIIKRIASRTSEIAKLLQGFIDIYRRTMKFDLFW